MRLRLYATLCLVPQLFVCSSLCGATSVGELVKNFELQDFRGKEVTLHDFADKDCLVVAFLGTECPLAKLYAPRLNELSREFGEQGVGFVGINSNTQDSITEIAAYARIHDISFPLLKDVGNRVADQMGASRTPEVFVLDSDRIVRYQGRIDDQYGVGYIRDQADRHDLRQALTELTSGQTVSEPAMPAVGCIIGRVKVPSLESSVTYSKQIARILQNRCVECHREGDIAPFALTEYEEVAGWADMIAEVVREQRMPPWHASHEHGEFSNDRRLSAEERRQIFEWAEAGAPQGDPTELPEPREFVEGWQLASAPDKVVPMSDKPFKVAAEGTVRYQYFRADPGFKEDMWVKGIEALPGNRAVVHHILVFSDAPNRSAGSEFGGGVRGFLGAYVPGMRATTFPPGMAKRIPAGSKLVFQMHYTPIGSVQEDLSKIGFVFADPEEVEYEVKTTSAFQPRLRIPKHKENHQEVTKTRVREPAQLLALMPHMHVRGKSFTYLARFPNEENWTPLLDIPEYDFNWQTNYRLARPMDLPKGTYIKCVAHFDNSENNLSNPNPNKTVRWGDQTWDEMLIGYFDVAIKVANREQASSTSTEGQSSAALRAEELILQLDKNDDDRLAMKELPARERLFLLKADQDKDGYLSPNEILQVLNRLR